MEEGKSKNLLPLLIFILAFGIKFIYLLGIKGLPFFEFPFADALYNLDWAKAPFFRAPLYPFFLSLLIKVFGKDLFVLRIIQIFIGSLSCILIYLLARRLFNSKVAILSAIFACFYAPLIFFDAEFLDTFFIIFFNIISVYILIYAHGRPSIYRFFLSGIIILPLAWLGIFLAFREWKRLSLILGFIFAYMFSVILFFVNTRFRLLVIPFLLIFSSFAILKIIENEKIKTKFLLIFLSAV